jgi:DNA-binding XRE family transcriptional regulator
MGEGLMRARMKKKWTQEELASKSGVSRVTIANIERGALVDVKISTMLKLSKALESSVEEIFLRD